MSLAGPLEQQRRDAGFRAYRNTLIHAANDTAFIYVAALVLLFNLWDWYVDPRHAAAAFGVRLLGASAIVASGVFQRRARRVEWAPAIAKLRLALTAGTIAWALALLDDGFLVGLSGLIIAVLGAAYSAIDRRDVFVLFLPPLLLTLAIMVLAGIETFVFINAVCFLALTMVAAWLLASVLELSYRRSYKLEQALLRESRVDALTGADNRRSLEEQGRAALSLCQRHDQPLSVLMIDLDHFKSVNDLHGHLAGDAVLVAVASICRGLMRESDRFGRWGGEEFLAVLPDTSVEQAHTLAERIRVAIGDAQIGFDQAVLRITTSIGVAGGEVPNDLAAHWTALIRAADDAMYRAKAGGRNRVVS
jgi:diguanylate cyclase (GGDEF)-like protein